MNAEQALAEIWGTLCPDCGPHDYKAIVATVVRQHAALREVATGKRAWTRSQMIDEAVAALCGDEL